MQKFQQNLPLQNTINTKLFHIGSTDACDKYKLVSSIEALVLRGLPIYLNLVLTPISRTMKVHQSTVIEHKMQSKRTKNFYEPSPLTRGAFLNCTHLQGPYIRQSLPVCIYRFSFVGTTVL